MVECRALIIIKNEFEFVEGVHTCYYGCPYLLLRIFILKIKHIHNYMNIKHIHNYYVR
jgi:hypothetical protein